MAEEKEESGVKFIIYYGGKGWKLNYTNKNVEIQE